MNEPFVVRLNGAGRITRASRSVGELLQRSPEELIGVPSLALIDAPDVRCVMAAYWDCVREPSVRKSVTASLAAVDGFALPAEIVMMNMGSFDRPEVIAEFRPQLPAPPPVTMEDAAVAMDVPSNAGVSYLRRLMAAGNNDFVVLMIEVGVHDSPAEREREDLMLEIEDRLLRCTRDSDNVFRHDEHIFLMVASGVRSGGEMMTVVERIRSTLGFPFIGSHDSAVVPSGHIGAALPAEAMSAEHLVEWAHLQLDAAQGGEGPFPFSLNQQSPASQAPDS